jgi:hypothetical protein
VSYDVVKAYERLMGGGINEALKPTLLRVLEREIRLDEAQQVERLLRNCAGLTAALAFLKQHIKALIR